MILASSVTFFSLFEQRTFLVSCGTGSKRRHAIDAGLSSRFTTASTSKAAMKPSAVVA